MPCKLFPILYKERRHPLILVFLEFRNQFLMNNERGQYVKSGKSYFKVLRY